MGNGRSLSIFFVALALIIGAAATGLVTGSGADAGPAATPCARTTTRRAHYKHVVVVVMENKQYNQVIGNAAAPYLTGLANQCASATKYAAVSTPSRPNYIAMTSGGTQGCDFSDADPPNSANTANNLFRQVLSTGTIAKSYVESMTSNCQIHSSGQYATKHNPWPYYIGPNDRMWCGKYDIPLGSATAGKLVNDINGGYLPRLAYIVPNLCNDTHDCSVTVGDDWLKSVVGRILAGPNYTAGDTAVIVTYDEYTYLPNVWISPSVRAHARSATAINHYALLRSVEEMLGLPLIGGAATAPSMRAAFNL